MIGLRLSIRDMARALAASLVVAASLALPASGTAQERLPCGTLYRVQRGDTLHSIAVRAYGEGDYLAIFEANRDILPNVTRIEIGQQLLIPCRDGSGPQSRAAILPGSGEAAPAADAAPADRPAALSAIPPDREIALLTGPDFAPFVHPALPEGGLTTELIRLALDRAAEGRPYRIVMADDWTAHLGLLERGEFDIGFPWYRPDCERAAGLKPEMRRRCADFAFSEPLFELRMAWYVRAGDPLAEAAEPAALAGRRLCRPASYFTFDLRQAGLMSAETTLVFPETAEECLVLLEAGVVDAVSLARAVAGSEIARLGLQGKLGEIAALASVETLHAIAPKSSIEGQAFLAALDAGLIELKESGRWYEVIARHLGPFGISLR